MVYPHAATKHLSIDVWLEKLGLAQYRGLFLKFTGVEALLSLGEADLKTLGIKHAGHRAKMASSLRLLRDKQTAAAAATGGKGAGFVTGSQKTTSTDHLLSYVGVSSPDQLRSDLEAELHGNPAELRSHEWYHGPIPRQTAEQLLTRKGQFLVRDSTSRRGDFVLSCHWHGVPLHFMINSRNPGGDNNTQSTDSNRNVTSAKIVYHLEDEAFDSVNELVQFYLGKCKPVTVTSGAIITNSVARTVPLSYTNTKYPPHSNLSPNVSGYGYAQVGIRGGTPTFTPSASPKPSPMCTPDVSPRLQRRKPVRSGSQPLLSLDEVTDRSRSHSPASDRFGSLPSIDRSVISHADRRHSGQLSNNDVDVSLTSYHQRAGSEPVLATTPTPTNVNKSDSSFTYLSPPNSAGKLASAISDSNLCQPPPPKPSRIPSVKYRKRPLVEVRNKALYEDDDRDYADYTQVMEEPSWLKNVELATTEDNAGKDTPPTASTNYAAHLYGHTYLAMHNASETISESELSGKPSTHIETLKLYHDRTIGQNASISRHSSSKAKKEHAIDANSGGDYIYDINFMKTRKILIPTISSETSYDLATFRSNLLSDENKPLETVVMLNVRTFLLVSNPRQIAHHMTYVDATALKIINPDNVTIILDLGIGVQSGLELITLPQGKQLRQDLLERSQCLRMFVATLILTCKGVVERARMLSQWIQTAMELRMTAGNLWGFSCVMEGIYSKQILRLRDTWLMLRQNHTSSAFLFDTKLRTHYRSLSDGSAILPLQNISIPNMVPLIYLLERNQESVLELLPWEACDNNFGLDIVLAHLDTTRLICEQFGLYRVVSQSVLSDMISDPAKCDPDLLDIFRTEFHMRLLWGSRGAGVNRNDRLMKYGQLLTILSERAEKPVDDGTSL